ncbi:hypothetical protein FOCC_FOCC014538, partial [Frankliniella occidentalis]
MQCNAIDGRYGRPLISEGQFNPSPPPVPCFEYKSGDASITVSVDSQTTAADLLVDSFRINMKVLIVMALAALALASAAPGGGSYGGGQGSYGNLGQDGHGINHGSHSNLGQDGHGVHHSNLGQDGHGIQHSNLGQDG